MIIWTATNYFSKRSCIISTLGPPTCEFEELRVWTGRPDSVAYVAGFARWLPLDLVGDAAEKLIDLTKLQSHEPPIDAVPNCFGLVARYDDKSMYRVEVAYLSEDLKQLFITDSKIN